MHSTNYKNIVMKKLNYSLSALTITMSAVLFLSSCGTVSLTQRKYNKGFHFEWASNQKANTKVEKPRKVEPVSDAFVLNDIQNLNTDIQTPSITQPMVDHSFITQTAKVKPFNVVKFMKEAKKFNNLTTHNEVITSKTFSKTTYLKAIQNTKDGDLDPIVLIILAILIPPVAVLLYDKEVSSRFIINLILTFLCWIPGVIHALIIVTGKK